MDRNINSPNTDSNIIISPSDNRNTKFDKDGGIIIGSETDESKNIKLHRSGDSELQLVSGNDSTSEGARSASPKDLHMGNLSTEQLQTSTLQANEISSGKIVSIEIESASSLNSSGYISLTGYSKVDVEVIPSLNIDWDQSNVFTKQISGDTNFTFSNDKSGQTILVEVANTDTSSHTINFPAEVLWPGGTAITDISATAINLYSFVKIGNNIHANGLEEMS